MDELLAILGGSWRPLLLYPGLAATLITTVLMRLVWNPRVGGALRPGMVALPPYATILIIACTLLLVALLPVPRSYWAYPIDLLTALLLLEAPHWLRLWRLRQSRDPATRELAVRGAGALLNIYPLIALAVALLGQASGSLLLTTVKSGAPLLRWAGIALWSLAIPPLVSLGPWHIPAGDDWLVTLRRVAHIALLVAIALPAGDQWDHTTTAAGAAVAFGSLTLLHYLWRGDPDRWERLQPFIALAFLALLLYTSAQAWMGRLR